jgi:hypothetical protein
MTLGNPDRSDVHAVHPAARNLDLVDSHGFVL